MTSTRDPGNLHVSQPQELARDLARDHIGSRDTTRSHDQTRYGRATRPLIGTWKTVGIRDKHNPVRSNAQYCAALRSITWNSDIQLTHSPCANYGNLPPVSRYLTSPKEGIHNHIRINKTTLY